MSALANDSLHFIEPTVLNYAEVIASDRRLQTLINELPSGADIDSVELLQFQIDKTRLVFCNFTADTFRIDSLCNVYRNDKMKAFCAVGDSYTVFYHLKNAPFSVLFVLYGETRSIKDGDIGMKIGRCAIRQTREDLYSWMNSPFKNNS